MQIFYSCAALMAVLTAVPLWSQSPSEAAFGSSEPLRPEEVVREAINRSPELAALREKMAALQLRRPPAMALPDPSLTVGWAGRPIPFDLMRGDPSSARTLSVGEQFPAPGKRRLAGELAGHDAEAAAAEIELTRRRITAEAEAASEEYLYAWRAARIIGQSRELDAELVTLADQQYRVGRGMQSDLIRAQLQLSLVARRQAEADQQLAAARITINGLLQRSPEAELPPPAEHEPDPLPEAADTLYASAETNAAELHAARVELSRAQTSLALAEKQLHPDIGLSYMLQQRDGQSTMHGLSLTLSLPIFARERQRPAIAEAAHMVTGARRQQETMRNQTRVELGRQLVAARTAAQLFTLYHGGILEQARLAFDSSLSGYRTGRADLSSVLGNLTALLDYQIDAARQAADQQIALARLRSLTTASTDESAVAVHPAASPQPVSPQNPKEAR